MKYGLIHKKALKKILLSMEQLALSAQLCSALTQNMGLSCCDEAVSPRVEYEGKASSSAPEAEFSARSNEFA